jgi:hypothetical protein
VHSAVYQDVFGASRSRHGQKEEIAKANAKHPYARTGNWAAGRGSITPRRVQLVLLRCEAGLSERSAWTHVFALFSATPWIMLPRARGQNRFESDCDRRRPAIARSIENMCVFYLRDP